APARLGFFAPAEKRAKSQLWRGASDEPSGESGGAVDQQWIGPPHVLACGGGRLLRCATAMDGFLPKEAFAGTTATRPAAPSYVGQAVFNGCIAFCNWRRDDVAAVLPGELQLATTTSAPAFHPVAFIFGEQTEGATIFAGITFPLGVRYHEFAMAIPFVEHRPGRALHIFVPRMYSSFFPATWAGNAHYGLAKAMATIQWHEATVSITTPDGATPFGACGEPAGDWTPGSCCTLPNFADVRAVFDMPVIGQRDDGSYVTSYFGWDFAAALVRPARATLSIAAPLARGIIPQTCNGLPSATFEVQRMIWRLSWPSAFT